MEKDNICICGEIKKLRRNCRNVYAKTCGSKRCISKLTKLTNIEKYGHESNLHGIVGKEKVLNTIKYKYGDWITNISQIPEVKERKKSTCRKNFGVDHPMQSLEILDKSKKSVYKKFGVDNVSKSKEIIDKIRNRMLEVDPESGLTVLQTSMIKREHTYLERYGFKYYFQTDEFKLKLEKKMIDKYGSSNYFSSDSFLDSMGRKRIENPSELQKYRNKVNSLTEKTFRKHFDLICGAFFRGKEYNLDHIYSVRDGFYNNVSPEIISSVINLQLIERSVNLKKSSNSWQTLEELLYLYNKL
jgi:hypothetical protein